MHSVPFGGVSGAESYHSFSQSMPEEGRAQRHLVSCLGRSVSSFILHMPTHKTIQPWAVGFIREYDAFDLWAACPFEDRI